MCPHDFLTELSEEDIAFATGDRLRALVMITVISYFGWRASTVVNLRSVDVQLHRGTFCFYSSSFKTRVAGGLPMGVLKLTHMPHLFAAV